jgi:hypothetical protein
MSNKNVNFSTTVNQVYSELSSVLELQQYCNDFITMEQLGLVKVKNREFPILAFQIGSKKEDAPCFGLFGGVHGIERIGTEVVTTFLASIFEELSWNSSLREVLSKIRIISIPIINPGGMFLNSRSNPAGVDIMRNAPVESSSPSNFLISGHRLSSKLPWFRGDENQMEYETTKLITYIKEKTFKSKFVMTLDIHSGFGVQDRLWYPWSKSKEKFPFFAPVQKLSDAFNRTYPHNIYKIEQQSDSYSTHGDVWDYLVSHYIESNSGIFIPWTLEIGSWTWLKKNPMQLFNSGGIFNPMKKHRFSRTMRRHKLLLNFLMHATSNSRKWV